MQTDTAGDRYYLFGPDRELIEGPAPSRAQLTEPAGRPPPPGSQVLKVPRGIVVVEAERTPGQPGSAQEPIVTVRFTDKGRRAFAALTERIAERGAETVVPPGTEKEAAFQRFAITLDNAVVSLATIDFRVNPEGIDGSTGAQINRIGSVSETRRLAWRLKAAPLPAELVPL